MAQPPREKRARGTARVAFIAHLDTIVAALEQGYTARAIYQRHQTKLGNAISYPQFVRYVRQVREDGTAAPPLGRPALASAPTAPVKSLPTAPVATPTPPPAPVNGSTHARHEPAPQRTFHHHGIVQEGEPEQLFGPGFLPKRRG
jgi:hypothetical protein